MENQKIINLLNHSNNQLSNFATKRYLYSCNKWYISYMWLSKNCGNILKLRTIYKMYNPYKKCFLWYTWKPWYCYVYMYNLIEYSDNFSDTWGSLLLFKRDKASANNANVMINNSTKCKPSYIGRCCKWKSYKCKNSCPNKIVE